MRCFVECIDCCTHLFTCISAFLVTPAVEYVVQLKNETSKDVTKMFKTVFLNLFKTRSTFDQYKLSRTQDKLRLRE